MKIISFFAHGIPKGQPRPRAFVRTFNGKPVARVFDSGSAENWKSQIAEAAKPFITGEPIDGPISVKVTFMFPRPKSHFRSNGKLKESAPTYHTSKPDGDNCVKALCDALTHLGIWRDDSLVCVQSITKKYAYSSPGAQIDITELENI